MSLFFVNGNSDSIKIVANAEGIRALKEELDQAEKSIRRNKSHLFGDPLWFKGSARLVAIEPAHPRLHTIEDEALVENTEFAPRVFLFSLIVVALTLMIIGCVAILRWIF